MEIEPEDPIADAATLKCEAALLKLFVITPPLNKLDVG